MQGACASEADEGGGPLPCDVRHEGLKPSNNRRHQKGKYYVSHFKQSDLNLIDQLKVSEDSFNAHMRQASTNFHAGAFKGTGGMHAIMEVEDAPEDANYYFSCH